MLSSPEGAGAEAGEGATASEREPECEFSDGSPRPINRVPRPVCGRESGVSSGGDDIPLFPPDDLLDDSELKPVDSSDLAITSQLDSEVAVIVPPSDGTCSAVPMPGRNQQEPGGENSVEVHSSGGDASQFYTAMKEMGFSSVEEVRGYLALAREPWPELSAEEKAELPKNDPRRKHPGFQSGPWDPTWKWCWEQVMKYGFSPAPKRIEVDERLLVVVDYAVSP